MKKITLLFFLVIVAGIGIGGGLFVSNKKNEEKQIASIQISENPQISPVEETDDSIGIPQRLRISKLNVDVPIEQVGKDSVGRMDVPKDWNNTAWYMHGPKPGEVGNAAIAGHVDDPSGNPSVFAKLTTLKAHDTIVITDTNGRNLEFSVTEVETVELSKFPGDKVFGQTGKKHLNLITCGGEWDRDKKEYTQRTIAYAILIEN